MSSVVQHITSSPPRSSKHDVSEAPYKGSGWIPMRSPTTGRKAALGNLNPSQYRKLEGPNDYAKALQDGIKRLQLPFGAHPSPDKLRKEFLDALSRRNKVAREYAEAERTFEDWESALRQVLGDKELQAISQAHDVAAIDVADTVMEQFLTAFTRMRLRDFCLSRKM